MLEKLKDNLPKEKKRIAEVLIKMDHKASNITLLAKKIDTSPSMITRTLKELGFYWWMNYQAFIVGGILQTNKNVKYTKFYEQKILSILYTFWGTVDNLKVQEIISYINKYKKITFVIREDFKMEHILRYYKTIFRSNGVRMYIVRDKKSTLRVFYFRISMKLQPLRHHHLVLLI